MATENGIASESLENDSVNHIKPSPITFFPLFKLIGIGVSQRAWLLALPVEPRLLKSQRMQK